MLRQNFLKQKLSSGKPVLGTWVTIPSVETADIIASSGLDFMIIDAEHGPISFERAQEIVMACESRGVSPVMRVPNINEADILKALDIGTHCIVVPNITCAKDIERLISMCKYPPLGNRGFSPFVRAGDYSLANASRLTEEANDNTLVAAIIEGEEAIRDIDSILAIEALDIVYIGLFDLSKALGIAGQVDHPRVMEHLHNLVDKINAKGKFAGTITTSRDKMQAFLELDIRFIVHLVDCAVLQGAYIDIRKQFEDLI